MVAASGRFMRCILLINQSMLTPMPPVQPGFSIKRDGEMKRKLGANETDIVPKYDWCKPCNKFSVIMLWCTRCSNVVQSPPLTPKHLFQTGVERVKRGKVLSLIRQVGSFGFEIKYLIPTNISQRDL